MKKKIVIGITVVLVIQAGWLIFWGQYISKRYIKTSATVIEVQLAGKAEYYPTYEYYDLQGRRYVDDDRYNDKIKKANPLYPVFGREVGEKVDVYYLKDSPADMMVLANAGSLILFAAPTWLALFPIVVSTIIIWATSYSVRKRSR